MLSMQGKVYSRRQNEIFSLYFPENRFWYFMQIVSNHDMSKPVFWEKQEKYF